MSNIVTVPKSAHAGNRRRLRRLGMFQPRWNKAIDCDVELIYESGRKEIVKAGERIPHSLEPFTARRLSK